MEKMEERLKKVEQNGDDECDCGYSYEELSEKMEKLAMTSRVHYKLDCNGTTHRFATMQSEGRFNAISEYISNIIDSKSFELFWMDDDSHVVLETEDDLTTAVEYALYMRKSDSTPPCVHLVLGKSPLEEAEAAAAAAADQTRSEAAADDLVQSAIGQPDEDSPVVGASIEKQLIEEKEDSSHSTLITRFHVLEANAVYFGLHLEKALIGLAALLGKADDLLKDVFPATDNYAVVAWELETAIDEARKILDGDMSGGSQVTAQSLANTVVQAENILSQLKKRDEIVKEFFEAEDKMMEQLQHLGVLLREERTKKNEESHSVASADLDAALYILKQFASAEESLNPLREMAEQLEPLEFARGNIIDLEQILITKIAEAEQLVNELKNQLNPRHRVEKVSRALYKKSTGEQPDEDGDEFDLSLDTVPRSCFYHSEDDDEDEDEEEPEDPQIDADNQTGATGDSSSRIVLGNLVFIQDPIDTERWTIARPDEIEEEPDVVMEKLVKKMEGTNMRLAPNERWEAFVAARDAADNQYHWLEYALEDRGLDLMLREQANLPATTSDFANGSRLKQLVRGLRETLIELHRLGHLLDPQDRVNTNLRGFAAKFELAADNASWLAGKLIAEHNAKKKKEYEDAERALDVLLYQHQERLSELGIGKMLRKQVYRPATRSDLAEAVCALECMESLLKANRNLQRLDERNRWDRASTNAQSFGAQVMQLVENSLWLVKELEAEIGETDRRKERDRVIKIERIITESKNHPVKRGLAAPSAKKKDEEYGYQQDGYQYQQQASGFQEGYQAGAMYQAGLKTGAPTSDLPKGRYSSAYEAGYRAGSQYQAGLMAGASGSGLPLEGYTAEFEAGYQAGVQRLQFEIYQQLQKQQQRYLAPAEIQTELDGRPAFYDNVRGIYWDGRRAWYYDAPASQLRMNV